MSSSAWREERRLLLGLRPPAAAPPARRRGPKLAQRGFAIPVLVGLTVLVILVLTGAAVLAYFYLNPPVIEAQNVAELFSTGPDIAFQEPAPGTQVGLGASVLVFATARDEDKVTRVDLWIDDQLVVQQVSPDFDGVTPLSLIHRLVATTPGTHSLVVRAYDSLGAMGESPTLYVTVLEEPEPAPTTVQYVVQPGDTPATVAQVMSTTVAAIQGENPGISQVITPGQTIVVPAPPPAPPQPKQAPAQPPAQPKPQPGGPAPGGQGPVAGGPGSDQKKPPGLVPADVIHDPGLLAPGVAQIDPAQIQFPIGGVMLDPPKTTVKKPHLEEPVAGDCTVTLSWQAGQQNERYKISREPFPAGAGNWHWMDVPQGQMTYTDQVPSPGQYRYQVVATTEIKGKKFEAPSKYETVTVSPSAKCIPSSQYKLVHFQPIEFKSKYKEGALFVTVGNVDARRVPPSDGKHYPVGDWSSNKVEEVWPAPVSVYLNPDEPVRLEISGEGSPGKPPPSLGSFAQAHSQSEMGPGKKLTGGNDKFQLTYYFWLEDVQWGKRKMTNSIKAPVLHLAEKAEDLKNRNIYRCRGCNPTTSRILFWDWTGDKDAIEGYILYRGYSCPGQEGESKAPLVLNKEYQGINIPPKTEPVGCVARYQVSAFGRAGESDPSKELVLDTAPAVSRVRVTFKDLLLSQQTTDQIHLQANQYHRTSEEMAIQAKTALNLNEVRFGGKKPNNALTVNLDQGETLQVSLLVGFCQLEPSKPLDPTKPGTYPLHFQGNQGECWGTVEIGALETVSAGEMARPEADISFMAPSLSGKDVYVQLDNLGPDSLAANRVKLESYWVTPGTKDKPLSPRQTSIRWWPALAETVEVKVGSVSDIKEKDPKEVEFYVKVTALDFTDSYESNNVWQGKIPDLIPLKGEPASPPKKRNLENGYKCTTNDECKSGYCADKQRCAPLAGQDGDYCHSHDHCEGFCLCASGNDGKYCSGWEGWSSGYVIWHMGVADYGVCRGRGENGAPCYANKDCTSNNCVETYEKGGIKRCTPQNGEGKGGEYCYHDDQCESRKCVACWGTDKCFDPGICEPKLGNGARCEWNETCQSDYCDDGRCAPPKGTGQGGEYCHNDDHCESRFCKCPTGYDGKFCKYWGNDYYMNKFGHGTCLARDKNGAPCNRNEECESEYCDSGKCAPKPGTGESGKYCHRDEHCQSDFCISGKCYQLADLGDVCRKNAECESGYCADTLLGGGWGRCARDRGGKSGEYCHHDNHCASGECDCRHGWFGFCANWEGWGRGSRKGTCK